MPQIVFFDQPVDDRAGSFAGDLLADLIQQLRVQERPAAYEACIQYRGQDFEIFVRKGDAFFQRAGGISDVKPDILQWIDHFLDQPFCFGRHFLLK